MPKIEKFIEERSFVTDRISTQVRIISIGLLVTTWSLLIGDVDIVKNIISSCRKDFIAISTIAIIALVFDYLQYLLSYLSIRNVLNVMQKENLEESDYDYDNRWYKWSIRSFIIKQLALLTGVIYFVGCMVLILFK